MHERYFMLYVHYLCKSCLFLIPWLTVNIVRLSEGPNKTDTNRCMRVFTLSEENKTGTLSTVLFRHIKDKIFPYFKKCTNNTISFETILLFKNTCIMTTSIIIIFNAVNYFL